MSENRLNIISVSASDDSSRFNASSNQSRLARTKEMQAKFERMWLTDPEQFNPLRNCIERERLDRTWQLLIRHSNPADKHVADIGCGGGVFSRRLRDAGAHVEAVDIAENALKILRESDSQNIHAKQDAMPNTSLPDHGFDIIVCTELIGNLPRDDHRLFFAELSRLVSPTGYLICSTAIDIDSDGGVEKLIELAQTEFDILDQTKSYHALYVRLKRMLEAPSRFIEGWQNPEFKKKELSRRQRLSRLWFRLNSSPFLVWIWFALDPLTRPFRRILKNSHTINMKLEKICRFFWDESGVSHFLFIAKRRPLKEMDPREIPVEHPRRKEIWE